MGTRVDATEIVRFPLLFLLSLLFHLLLPSPLSLSTTPLLNPSPAVRHRNDQGGLPRPARLILPTSFFAPPSSYRSCPLLSFPVVSITYPSSLAYTPQPTKQAATPTFRHLFSSALLLVFSPSSPTQLNRLDTIPLTRNEYTPHHPSQSRKERVK